MSRFVLPYQTIFTADGSASVPGAKVYFYEAGTSTPKDTYSDVLLTTPNANPIIADSAGRIDEVFMGAGEYKVIITDANDAQIDSSDNVGGVLSASGFDSIYDLLIDGRQANLLTYNVSDFFDTAVGGGGALIWKSAQNKNTADGVEIFDPDTMGGWTGSSSNIDTTFHGASGQGTGVGTGCWVRVNKSVFHAIDGGAIGVTDDTPMITALIAAAANKTLEFDGSITHTVSQIDFNQPGTVRTNGCTFKSDGTLTSSSPIVLVTSDDLDMDIVYVNNTGNETTKYRMIIANGCDNTHIGKLKVDGTALTASGSDLDAAIRIDAMTGTSSIGEIDINNFDIGCRVFGANVGFGIGKFKAINYVTALNIRQGKHVYVGFHGGIHIETRSPNASVTPGHNGILISNDGGVNFATEDIVITDAYIRNAGEHGIRIAGDNHTRAVKLIRPNVGGSGGSNIKFLSGDDGVYAYEPLIDNPVCVDALNEGVKLSCGIIMYRIIDGVINNPVIKKVSHTYSGTHGISLYDVTGLSITGPQIADAEEHGISIRITHNNAAAAPISKDTNQLKIDGGLITASGIDGINIPCEGRTHRGMVVDGTLLRANTGQGVNITSTGSPSAGQLDNGSFRLFLDGNTAGAFAVGASVGNTGKIHGNFSGQDVTETKMANGSQKHDEAGTFEILKAAVWTAL